MCGGPRGWRQRIVVWCLCVFNGRGTLCCGRMVRTCTTVKEERLVSHIILLLASYVKSDSNCPAGDCDSALRLVVKYAP
jgi:hypothetical protein